MQLFSYSLSGGLPWTNIVPYAGSSGGPFCVWRNGELTPMSEPFNRGIVSESSSSSPNLTPRHSPAKAKLGLPIIS